MNQIHKRIFIRNDKKELYLYGYNEHQESSSQELDITEIPKPHMRWNPSREEWVTYSAGRKDRTSFPPKEYCPLCPGTNLNYPTEIPFSNFEVAVFPNRWASFNPNGANVFLASAELSAISSILGRIPSVEEYHKYMNDINPFADDIYKYLNFNQIESYIKSADSADIPAINIINP